MPTTYAHNLFGKMVYHRLRPELQTLVDRHSASYIIGLHGPDILFYTRPFHKNRVNALGHRMHREKAAPFFEKGKELYRQEADDEMLAYLFGFICHFMLDSTCHPYISQYMARAGASHDEIETEFDRVLMESTGKDPFVYRPSSVVRINPESVRAIAKVLEGMTEKDIAHTLAAMKLYTDSLVCPTAFKRNLILKIARATGVARFIQGKFILKKKRANCLQSTEELKKLFRMAVPETAGMLEAYYRAVMEGRSLSGRFDRDYR